MRQNKSVRLDWIPREKNGECNERTRWWEEIENRGREEPWSRRAVVEKSEERKRKEERHEVEKRKRWMVCWLVILERSFLAQTVLVKAPSLSGKAERTTRRRQTVLAGTSRKN